ncbi:CynX/NimT family MFS transporter [Paenibacillus ehimensis]|uniref:MFS transporter n=1 Tax=Paenibacillus ehimensis TaxID=79264 RepID=A0ABT8VJR7_9BACL|nr:MFS transporter [Paenibacillus ehimensis]MDO3681218.1 MFS transporter [Paenibacillus ehimensis]MEC0212830.1 MFS transporter [Paenibacillus ehimensis]
MIPAQDTVSSRVQTGAGLSLLILGIVLIAANLRAPLTAVGPIIGEIRGETGISNTWAGMMTTLPLLAFALLSPLSPRIARRLGMEHTLFAGLIVLLAGILLRSLSSVAALFAGTALIGIAIAVSNVLVPALIKREFPNNVGTMTGIYSVSMNLCAAIASGVSIPISQGLGLGWRGALGSWALLAIVSLAAWLPMLRSRRRPQAVQTSAAVKSDSLWRSPLAWQITLFMGLQSLFFYVNISWLPAILQDRGMSAASAGWMISIMQFASLPATFFMPILAGRRSDQRGLAVGVASVFIVGYLGLLLTDTDWLVPLWVVLVGIGAGSGFGLAVMFFALRTNSVRQSAEMSGMAQSFGYLLAAVGPTLFGFIHDSTGGWTIPLLLLLVAAGGLLLAGLKAGKYGYVMAEGNKEADAVKGNR